MQRGEVWWAALGRPRGPEPGLRRPVVVVQANEYNRSALRTVVVACLTSNLDLAAAPGNVLCRPRATGLPKASVVNVTQVATLDRNALLERVGRLPPRLLDDVNAGLCLVLDLP